MERNPLLLNNIQKPRAPLWRHVVFVFYCLSMSCAPLKNVGSDVGCGDMIAGEDKEALYDIAELADITCP